MLDDMVIKNYYTYMFCCNYMDYSRDEMKVRFLETMEHFKFYKYIAVEERGAEHGLLHLQGVLWHHDQYINCTAIKSFRFNKQRLRKKTNKDTTQISVTKGKKDTLASYSCKEISTSPFVITNLNKRELKMIPKWIDYKDAKKAFQKRVREYAVGLEDHHPKEFRNLIIEFYLENTEQAPNLHTLRKLSLLFCKAYTTQDYQDEIGSLRNTRWSDEFEAKNSHWSNNI